MRIKSVNLCSNFLFPVLPPLSEFVKEAGRGGKGNLPLEGSPLIVKSEPWDGKDGEIVEEDEFSLEELMGDDASSKDEL